MADGTGGDSDPVEHFRVTAVVDELNQVLTGDEPVSIHTQVMKPDPATDGVQLHIAESRDVCDGEQLTRPVAEFRESIVGLLPLFNGSWCAIGTVCAV